MMYRVVTILSLCLTVAPALLMRRITEIPRYPCPWTPLVCCDSDHDSLPEIIFSTGRIDQSFDPTRVEVWEHEGWNRFKLVYADTADSELFRWPWWPSRIKLGNAVPMAAGDIDEDGLTDLLCVTFHVDTIVDTLYLDVITVESPDVSSYPCSLTWYCPYMRGDQAPSAYPAYLTPDLDEDGRGEILVLGMIWENVRDDSNELVWRGSPCGMYYAFGDFCSDGRVDFASGGGSGGVAVDVWGSSGADSFERIWQDTWSRGQPVNLFSTADIDGNGRPEFYLTEYSSPESRAWLFMYQCKSAGSHQFTRTMVDSLTCGSQTTHSAGGDIDGDGVDELIWTMPCSIRVYKAFGENDLRMVWELPLSSNPFIQYTLTTTIHDVNSDGYNELLLGVEDREGEILVFEVDAVDLLAPNGGSYSVGDTVEIRWATHLSPRCDSLSLFLRRDSSWNLDTLAHGLPATDTLYRWVVPNNVPDTGRIVVIAYGPGWQFDMSDSVISFIGGGVAEGTSRVYVTRLRDCSPNPLGRATTVSYEIARGGRVALSVHDVSGRLVRRLEDGFRSTGPHAVAWNGTDSRGMAVPAGVYFVCFSANGVTQSRRVTLVR
jgi:hypothetical protein